VLALAASYSTSEVVCLVALAALIFWSHRSNIVRLRKGTEPRIGEKKADADDAAPVAAVAAAVPATVVAEAAPEPAPPAEPTPEA
jgi:hypothetical protein